jgi:hypothetical protein
MRCVRRNALSAPSRLIGFVVETVVNALPEAAFGGIRRRPHQQAPR